MPGFRLAASESKRARTHARTVRSAQRMALVIAGITEPSYRTAVAKRRMAVRGSSLAWGASR
jgi:hypothetical protein